MDYRTYLRNYPDQEGRFGPYGGAYLSDELKPAFEEISEAYQIGRASCRERVSSPV